MGESVQGEDNQTCFSLESRLEYGHGLGRTGVIHTPHGDISTPAPHDDRIGEEKQGLGDQGEERRHRESSDGVRHTAPSVSRCEMHHTFFRGVSARLP